MKQPLPENARISKTTKKLMVIVALLFDLVPLGLVILMMVVIGYLFMGTIGDNVAAIGEENTKMNQETKASGQVSGVDIELSGMHSARSAYHAAAIGLKAITGGLASLTAGIVVGPILYSIASFVATLFGYVFFTFWFLFKKVNIWSFSKPKRLFTTVGTACLESLPLLNFLPGITVMVYTQATLAQTEDRVADTAVHTPGMSRVAGAIAQSKA